MKQYSTLQNCTQYSVYTVHCCISPRKKAEYFGKSKEEVNSKKDCARIIMSCVGMDCVLKDCAALKDCVSKDCS